METLDLFESEVANEAVVQSKGNNYVKPYKSQLLKWVGNKQRQATDIIQNFPSSYSNYIEPFLGSGGVLGVLAPQKAIASDIYSPLMQIWEALSQDPELLYEWYESRYRLIKKIGKKEAYQKALNSFNLHPNGADFVFILRTCYGGVVRFRKSDGQMSTPCGPHSPITPESFRKRINEWAIRTKNTKFLTCGFEKAMDLSGENDLIYCDPPYSDTQKILYGAQDFNLELLFSKIAECKKKGVMVALSIDGTKLSGKRLCDIKIPDGLFEKEVFINVGGSMLKRFQVNGGTVEQHHVKDRLLLTY